MKDPKKIAKGKIPQMSDEQKVQAIFRQYSQKFSVYMEAAVFNMLGNSSVTEKRSTEEIIALGADIAEKMIDAVPQAINEAFARRMEAAAKKAEAEQKEEQK